MRSHRNLMQAIKSIDSIKKYIIREVQKWEKVIKKERKKGV